MKEVLSRRELRVWLPFALAVAAVLVVVAWALVSPSTLALTSAPTQWPLPTVWPIPEQLASAETGINVHMWWDRWAAIGRDWRLVEEAGFTWAKQRVAWLDVEGAAPGVYEWFALDSIVDEAEQADVRLLLRLDHPPAWAIQAAAVDAPGMPVAPEALAGFCSVIANRYKGRVDAYQIWNEPNLAREWGGAVPDPAGYTEILRACYVAIKTEDPGALVVSAGLAPTGSAPPEAIPDVDYLSAMYEVGAAPYFDLLGLNAPGYKAPPEVSPDEAADPANDYGGHPFFCFRHVENMRDIMVAQGDEHKQVAILEFGWHTNGSPEHPDYAWFAVTPEVQADYLVRAYAYAEANWAPWIGPMFVWNLPDAKWTEANEEYWWSIVDPFWWGKDRPTSEWPGAGVRPAYDALKARQIPNP